MQLNSNDEIQIKQILKSNGEPSFIEFYSPADSRTHIMSAEKFCEVFGYTVEDLKVMR